MPEKSTVDKAQEDLREGKSPSTAAGEFVHEEIEHVREGKHGARSPQQAIAIGLSKARRAGIPLKPPPRGSASAGRRPDANLPGDVRRRANSRSNASRARALRARRYRGKPTAPPGGAVVPAVRVQRAEGRPRAGRAAATNSGARKIARHQRA